MQVRYSVHISEAQARFEHIGQRAANFEGILKRWGGFFKAKALARADSADGWPPLKESTRKKLQHQRTSNITSQGKVRESYATALERHLIRQQRQAEARRQFGDLAGSTGAAKILSSASSVRAATGAGTASADLQELRRLRTAGAGAVDRDAKGRAVAWRGSPAINRLRKRLVKAEKQLAVAKLQRAEDRADGEKRAGGYQKVTVGGDRRKADNHQLLGRVARSLQWDIEGSKVSAYSKIPWSEVHNAGGTAGHGAPEPQREFLAIHDDDRIELSDIVLSHLRGESGR